MFQRNWTNCPVVSISTEYLSSPNFGQFSQSNTRWRCAETELCNYVKQFVKLIRKTVTCLPKVTYPNFLRKVCDTIRKDSSPMFVNWWHITTLLGFYVFWPKCGRHASNHQWTQISVLTRTSCSQIVSSKIWTNVHHNTVLMFSWEQYITRSCNDRS